MSPLKAWKSLQPQQKRSGLAVREREQARVAVTALAAPLASVERGLAVIGWARAHVWWLHWYNR